MDKVYSVFEGYENHGALGGAEIKTHLFSTLEKAQECFKKLVETAKEDCRIKNGCWMEENDNYFDAFIEDYFCITIYIEEKEIQ